MSKQLWTPEEVLFRIRQLYNAGNDCTHKSASKVSPRLVSAALRYFGSWGRAVEEAGIDYSTVVSASRQRGLEKRIKWSHERIVERIRELANNKEPLGAGIVSKRYPELYASACSDRYFSGWANALKAAGVRVEDVGSERKAKHADLLAKWRTELLLERIHQVIGSCHSTGEREIRMISPALHEAAIKRFGSWIQVLEAILTAGTLNNKKSRTSRRLL